MKECHCLGMTSVGIRMLICFVSMYHCFSTIIPVSHENKFYRLNFIFERKKLPTHKNNMLSENPHIYVKESERMTR